MKVSIFLPAFNVEKSLKVLLAEFSDVETIMRKHGHRLRVHVIDDASTDQTADILELAGSAYQPWFSYHINDKNRGNAANILTGYGWAVDSGADVVGCMDADGEHSPNDLLRHLRWIEEDGYDGVAGSINFPEHDQNFHDRHMMRHHGSMQAALAGVDGMFYIQSPGYNLHRVEGVIEVLLLYQEYAAFFAKHSTDSLPRWGMHGVLICLLGQKGVGARIKAAYLPCFGQSPNRHWEKLLQQSNAASAHATMLMAFLEERRQRAA